MFRSLGWRGFSETVGGDDLRSIILSLARRERGYEVAIDVLSMRLSSNQNETNKYPAELIDVGRELLSSADFSVRDSTYAHHLYTVANVCLRGAGGSAAAQSLCERIKQGAKDHTFRAYNYEQFLRCIFELQSRIALDVFFGDSAQSDSSALDAIVFDGHSDYRKNPVDGVPLEEMLCWCDEKPTERYPVISRAVSCCTSPNEGTVEWTPLAMEILKRAPDPVIVLETFVSRFYPRSWSGSRATVVESRLRLLDRLGELNIAALNDYVTRIRPQLVDDIARMRTSEDERDSARDEQFE